MVTTCGRLSSTVRAYTLSRTVSSASRPTMGELRYGTPRAGPPTSPVSRNARTGIRRPRRSSVPRSSNAKPRALWAVRSETSTSPGSAEVCSRAATLTTSPVTIADPGSGLVAASTSPVFTPMRICRVRPCETTSSSLTESSRRRMASSGTQRAGGVVLVRGGDAERGHHRVADELLDRPALCLDLLPHRVEVLTHHRAQPLRVQVVGEHRRAGDVGEEDGDELALLTAVRERGPGRARRTAPSGRAATAVPAVRAELVTRRQRRAAARAGDDDGSAARRAEPGVGAQTGPADRAGPHGSGV